MVEKCGEGERSRERGKGKKLRGGSEEKEIGEKSGIGFRTWSVRSLPFKKNKIKSLRAQLLNIHVPGSGEALSNHSRSFFLL